MLQANQGRQARGARRATAPPVLWWSRGFPGEESQVREARHWIEDLLPPCDPLADLVLLASELCANAVMHTRSGNAGGRFTVDVEWEPRAARVVIGDQGSPTAPAVAAKAQDAIGADEEGRGLWLVDELADDWGTATHLGNRWVWIDMQWQAKGGPLLQAPGGCEAMSADVAGMRAAFPGTTIWWGHQTQAWRATLPGPAGTSSLVEAPTGGALRQVLAAVYPGSGSGRDHAR